MLSPQDIKHNGSESDDDLETIIANRRSDRDARGTQTEDQSKEGYVVHQSGTSGRPSQQLRLSSLSSFAERVETKDTLAHPFAQPATRGEAREESIRPSGEDIFSNLDNLENFFDDEWQPYSVSESLKKSTDSPLFVPRDCTASVAHTASSIPISKLLPANYDSDSNQTDSVRTGGHSRQPSPNFKNSSTVASTRSTTMKDVFRQHSYMEGLKNNPYTSGIFEYEGLPKHQAYKRAQTSNATNMAQKQGARNKPHIIPRNPSQDKKVVSKAHVPSADRPSLSQSPPMKRARMNPSKPENLQFPSSASPFLTLYHSPSTKQEITDHSTTTGPPSIQAPTLPQQRSTEHRDTTELRAFLHENARKYEDCLNQIGCSHERNGEYWQALETSMRTDVDNLTQLIRNRDHFDAETIKNILTTWDMDIGVRVIFQKYIMYSCLRESMEK